MSWVSSNTKMQGTTSTTEPSTGYVRPADWPALPTISEGEQKFAGLYAVFDSDSNFIALSATGAYTVDWGDGSTPENIASGVQANHIYDYSTVTSIKLLDRMVRCCNFRKFYGNRIGYICIINGSQRVA